MEQNLEELQTSCQNDYKLDTLLAAPKIQLVTITKKGQMANIETKQKVFYLFGEHPRELISPETGLNLINTLCGKVASSNPNLDELLEKNVFQIVVNANPLGRMLVEQGQACQRTNEHGVDLNRNWDDHWEQFHTGDPDTNPGTSAFSEIESLKVKEALESFMPHIFATIHSGTLGMYTPYAFSRDTPTYNEPTMLEILNTMNEKYCGCDVGAAGDKVGYLCPGTCLDYAYDRLKVPYTYAFEIYSTKRSLPAMFHFTSLLQMRSKGKSNKNSYIMKNNKEVGSCFLQTSMKTSTALTNEECFGYFNPSDQTTFHIVVDNWTKALLDLTLHVHKHRQTNPTQNMK